MNSNDKLSLARCLIRAPPPPKKKIQSHPSTHHEGSFVANPALISSPAALNCYGTSHRIFQIPSHCTTQYCLGPWDWSTKIGEINNLYVVVLRERCSIFIFRWGKFYDSPAICGHKSKNVLSLIVHILLYYEVCLLSGKPDVQNTSLKSC